MPFTIFHIAGLLADEQQARLLRSLAENCLGRIAIEVAAFTRQRGRPQVFERAPLG
jgi:hypothetical protein